MRVSKIEINNYRLLKAFSMNLEEELSLVIGKNNTGKTSILSVLEKFLSQSEKTKITFDDFNIEFKKDLRESIENDQAITEADFKQFSITLRVFIEYYDSDNLANISRVMTDLDPRNNIIALGFEYSLSYQNYLQIRKDYAEFSSNEEQKKEKKTSYRPKGIYEFLEQRHSDYFTRQDKSFAYDLITESIIEGKYIDLTKMQISIREIINFKFISAKRDVTNQGIDKTLSGQTSRIYERTEVRDDQSTAVEEFKDKLIETDTDLSTVYKKLFGDIVKKVRSFGGIKANESQIEIISTLQHRELLKGNTTVIYKHDEDNRLPEHYNGLGYMNLISMIFEIEILVQEFKREKDASPADINLLFIEEPEAHTHPQMQYVFIKNIKLLLKEGIKRNDGQHRKLQYVISTHSSHIVADSDFDDIKYLRKIGSNEVIAKNLKELRLAYENDTSQYQFLKQYLTVSRAEIFFADKTVLIEGDTERILISTLMRKVDIEAANAQPTSGDTDKPLPLLSQNISIIEVGAYSQIFEKFIDFIGIKTLIITDLDTVDSNGKKCPVSTGVNYSNAAIRFFFTEPSLADLKSFGLTSKVFDKINGVWKMQTNGQLCVVYQIKEADYHARSFEDSFIHINRDFLKSKKDSFQGLKNSALFDDGTKNAYDLAEHCIEKKTHFALDTLYHSADDLSNWKIPSYIHEGLLWLKQD